MDSFAATSKEKGHVRSISLPSPTHPLTTSVEDRLYKLKASPKLDGLKELYGRVDDLLQLPLTQLALSRERHSECLEGVLDGSLRLLDICGDTRDVFSQMKECVQELESSLRRRRSGERSLEDEVGAYMTTRKRLNKVIYKCFGNLKRTEKNCTSALLDKNSDLVTVVSKLREVEGISFKVFESLLSSVCQQKSRSKISHWSLVSKLLQSKRASCEGEVDTNEVEKMDAELLILKSCKIINLVQVQKVLKGLQALELSLQEAEEELEYAFRQLMKARVSLLNILSH